MEALTNIPFLPKNKLGHLFIFWVTEVVLMLVTYQIFRASGHGADLASMEVSWTSILRFVLSDDMLFFVILYILFQFLIQNITESVPSIVAKIVAANTSDESLNSWAVQRQILAFDDSTRTYRQGKHFVDFTEGSPKRKSKRYKRTKRDVTKAAVLLLALTAVLVVKPFGWLKWMMIVSALNGVVCIIGTYYIVIDEHKDKRLHKQLKKVPPPASDAHSSN